MMLFQATVILMLHVSPQRARASLDETAETDPDVCSGLKCSPGGLKPVCGFRTTQKFAEYRPFKNLCELLEYGCENLNITYGMVSYAKCQSLNLTYVEEVKGIQTYKEARFFTAKTEPVPTEKASDSSVNRSGSQNNTSDIMVVYDYVDRASNVSQYIEDFFGRSFAEDYDILDMKGTFLLNDFEENPEIYRRFFDSIPETQKDNPETRRSKLFKSLSLKNIYTWYKHIPEEVTEMHSKETFSSCLHNCPEECPDVYQPVCGVPGSAAPEPSLVFLNHCFMDLAQCKIYRENKQPRARASAYKSLPFVFCLGDQMHNLIRFIPVLRTLQRMKRIKQRAVFRYRVQNWKFFNNRLGGDYRPMG